MVEKGSTEIYTSMLDMSAKLTKLPPSSALFNVWFRQADWQHSTIKDSISIRQLQAKILHQDALLACSCWSVVLHNAGKVRNLGCQQ
jgi:hypothetical protein